MPELDRYAPYLLSAFGITWVVLGGYLLFLRSRLVGLRRQLATLGGGGEGAEPDQAQR